jgi:hypothetical protein
MDAFEQLIGQLLTEEKYWVQQSVKINLTKEERRLVGKPKMPRAEIDIVALDMAANTIWLLEAKSFLDSSGVVSAHVIIEQELQSGRYKLLTSKKYRDVLYGRLREDWLRSGHINAETKISCGLIAGNVYQNKEAHLSSYFAEKEWFFWGPTIIKEKIRALASKGYENNAVTIASKFLIR